MKANTFLAATLALGLAGAGSAFAADPLVTCSAELGEGKVKGEAEQLIGEDNYEVSLTCVDGWSGYVYFTPTEGAGDARFQLVGARTTDTDDVSTCAIDLVMVYEGQLGPIASKSEAKCSASKGNGKENNKDKLEVEIKKVSVEI